MTKYKVTLAAAAVAITLVGPGLALAEDYGDGWEIKNSVDEEIRYREAVGLSKDRTEGKSIVDKNLNVHSSMFDSLRFHTTLRASYDAVYDLNAHHFGDEAGGAVSFQDRSGSDVQWGQGLGHAVVNGGSQTSNVGLQGAYANNAFGFTLANNPNQGLELVDGWRGQDQGLAFATPVRPCNIDHRGCMPGYMNKNTSELAAPDFNERLDFLREMYVDADLPVAGNTLAIRFGRQQLVWGRTDLFRVLDVINPVDYSRNNIYDQLEDMRLPMGMLRADYRMGAKGPFDDLNFQGVWVWEQWRPDDLGQAGSPNQPLGAASLFRAMKTCWDYGCTVANFANGNTATDFGPHQIGIRNVNLPGWTLSNTTVGGKVEGEVKGVGFSLNALTFRSQMPALHGARPSVNSFTGVYGTYAYAPVFDIEFPRIMMYGGSIDYSIDPIDTAIRMEVAYTQGEHFADTATWDLWKKSDVVRYVIGADRNTFIPFLNEHRAFLISTQLFGQHINAYDLRNTSQGMVGIPDFQDNWISTLLVKGWYDSDTLSPQVVFARDWGARANVIEPSVEWLPSNMWRLRLGANLKFGDYRQSFDNNTSQNAYLNGQGNPTSTYATAASNLGGAWGWQPLGMFQSGILGMAHAESEIFANATLRF